MQGRFPSHASLAGARGMGSLGAERLLHEQNEVLRLMALDRPLREVLDGVVAFLERSATGCCASVMLVDETRTQLRLGSAPRLARAFAASIDSVPIGPRSGICGSAAYSRTTVITTDLLGDPRTAPWSDLARAAGLRGCVSSPILDSAGVVSGTFALYFFEPREPSAAEMQLVDLARDLASVAIERDRDKRAHEQLQRDLERRVVERTEELESFTHAVSHDLRAPLRAIDGRLAMLREDLGRELEPELGEHLESARRAARQLSELIDGLLALSRSGCKPIKLVAFDMAALVRDVWSEMDAARAGRAIEFTIGPLPECVADRGLIAQAWVNLLSNAVKYSRDREVAHITVSGERREDHVVYALRDDGIGFDAVHAEQIFGVFQRLHTNEAYEGTGVGLALVRRIVERHGGRAWAEGAPDAGATFWIELPAPQS